VLLLLVDDGPPKPGGGERPAPEKELAQRCAGQLDLAVRLLAELQPESGRLENPLAIDDRPGEQDQDGGGIDDLAPERFSPSETSERKSKDRITKAESRKHESTKTRNEARAQMQDGRRRFDSSSPDSSFPDSSGSCVRTFVFS
jgi:hypothetical protein